MMRQTTWWSAVIMFAVAVCMVGLSVSSAEKTIPAQPIVFVAAPEGTASVVDPEKSPPAAVPAATEPAAPAPRIAEGAKSPSEKSNAQWPWASGQKSSSGLELPIDPTKNPWNAYGNKSQTPWETVAPLPPGSATTAIAPPVSPTVTPAPLPITEPKPASETAASDMTPANDDAPHDQMRKELAEIRRKLGIRPTSGTIFDNSNEPEKVESFLLPQPPPEDGFQEVLSRVARAPRLTAPHETASSSAGPQVIAHPEVEAPLAPLPAHRPLGMGKMEATDDEQLLMSLRHSARLLDAKANDLEEMGRFDEADRLRNTAERLRLEARRMNVDVEQVSAEILRLRNVRRYEPRGPYYGDIEDQKRIDAGMPFFSWWLTDESEVEMVSRMKQRTVPHQDIMFHDRDNGFVTNPATYESKSERETGSISKEAPAEMDDQTIFSFFMSGQR